ncbi:MAG TPA: diaminopimelate epimerase [Candidatus Polarisedimenticolia bacterium]|nr:diaminopimelate epimerase [Candidatus Polarisedimenticolia bacterium]
MIPHEFFKMSAAGNDFIVFDNRAQKLPPDRFRDVARQACTRALSVGADGVILLESSVKADVRARFLNPDGEPTFCGNGARCAARLAYLQGWAPARMVVETDRGLHRAEVAGSMVTFEMPDPQGFEPVEVTALGRSWRGAFVETGVPHFVAIETELPAGPIDAAGAALRSHPRFGSAGANVNFVAPRPEGGFSIRTFERGVEAETLACGTGCVAAALAIVAGNLARPPIVLRTRSGVDVAVRFEGPGDRARGVRLEGEARLVYVAQLSDEALEGFLPKR